MAGKAPGAARRLRSQHRWSSCPLPKTAGAEVVVLFLLSKRGWLDAAFLPSIFVRHLVQVEGPEAGQ